MAKGDTAYTNIALGAHTDNTYFVGEHVNTHCIIANSFIGPFRRILPDSSSSTSCLTLTDQAEKRSWSTDSMSHQS